MLRSLSCFRGEVADTPEGVLLTAPVGSFLTIHGSLRGTTLSRTLPERRSPSCLSGRALSRLCSIPRAFHPVSCSQKRGTPGFML